MNFHDFVRLSMSAVSHETANTTSSLRDLFDVTLFRIQRQHAENDDHSTSAESLVNKSIEELVSQEAIVEKTATNTYELSPLAVAAVSGTL